MSLDITLDLLEENQIIGENKLEIFDKIETKAAVTDFAILCGAFVPSGYYVNDEDSLENRAGWYFTKTAYNTPFARVIMYHGSDSYNNVVRRDGGVRLALPFSKISPICSNMVRGKNGELIVECGMFPQQSVSKKLEDELNISLTLGLLEEVDFVPTDSTDFDSSIGFNRIDQKVYEYNGERYARVKANPYEFRCTLSNGRTYKKGDYAWVKVAPLRWYVCEDSGIAFTEKLIVSGVQFNNEQYYQGDFEKTDLYQYINNYLSQAMGLVPTTKEEMIKYLKTINEFLRTQIFQEQELITKSQAKIENMKHLIDSNNEKMINLDSDKGQQNGYQKTNKGSYYK